MVIYKENSNTIFPAKYKVVMTEINHQGMMLFRTPVINNFLVSDLTIKRTRAVFKSKLFLLVISRYMYRKLEENVSMSFMREREIEKE